MTEANTSPTFREKCEIYQSIEPKDLLTLLNVVVESLRVAESVTDPENQLPKIYPQWLSLKFTQERAIGGVTPPGFYIHPLVKKRSDAPNLRPNILTLEDVASLYRSLPAYIEQKIREGKFSDIDVLNAQQLELYNRIKADHNGELIRIDLGFLKPDSQVVLSIVATLAQNVPTGEKAPEVKLTLPDEFKALLEGSLNLAVSWEWVKPFVQDVLATELNAPVAFFNYEGAKRGVNVREVRFFLNTWLKKLYDEYSDKFREKGTPLPDSRLFDATNKFPLYFDLETWVQLDIDVTKFIANELGPVIEEFQKGQGVSVGGPVFQKKDTKEDEDKQKVTDKARKPEDIDDLLEKFSNAGKSYTDETNRLTTILLPQFFSMHGIRRDLVELSSIDGANFGLVEREFRNELENVIRSLSPDELKLLSTRGGSLEFRLIVLRKLYGKLSTNPRFVGALSLYKENYVKELERRIAKGEPLQSELNALNKQSNLADDAFDREMAQREKSQRGDWTRGDTADSGINTLVEVSGLHDITQRDLQVLLSRIAGDTLDYDLLLRNLDVLIAERWSPETLRNINITEARAIFGFVLPDAISRDERSYQLFLSLCAEYLYARRQHLADHYQLDAISRDSGKPADLSKLAEAQDMAARYKDYGGGEALVVARASDSHRVGEYQSSIAAGVKGIHEETKEQRKQNLDGQQTNLREQYKSTTTIAGKRALLASLGVLTPEIDDVNQTEDAQLSLLDSRFNSAMDEDYADGISSLDDMSYYEDQDGDYVQDTGRGYAVPQRYGRPGGRSLMKGALNLRSKYKKAKERISQAKNTIKQAKKGADATVKTVKTIISSKDNLKKGALAVALASVIDTVSLMTQNGLSTILGIGGGALGAFLGIQFGPAGWFAGTFGGLVGAWGGAHAGAYLTDKMPFLKDLFNFARLQLPGASAGATSLLPPATSAAAATATSTQSSQVSLTVPGSGNLAPVVAVAGTMTAVALTTMSSLSASLQPPPISTLNSSGLESQYITIRKTTTSDTNFPGAAPGQLTYQIYLQAKGDYQIDLTNFQDKFTVKVNTEKNNGSPAELSCDSQLNMDTAKIKTFSSADGEVLLGECTVPVGDAYHDSSILNEITVQFKVSENGTEIKNTKPNPSCGESENTFCALTSLSVCLGECPAAKQGCWPVTGVTTQPPYGQESHSVVDAIDIGAPLGRTVYATFDGTAYAFDAMSPEPSEQGLVFKSGNGGISRIYGKHVLLVTGQGSVLLFGHLSQHSSNLQLGQGVQVKAGDVIGYIGNSGSVGTYLYPNGSTVDRPMGMHSHYEYRVPAGGAWKSVIPGKPKDPLSSIVPGKNGAPYSYVYKQTVISYDGGTKGTLPPCSTQ